MEVVAVADDKLGRPGRYYRGIRVLADDVARVLPHDLAVVANLSPEHAKRRLAEWTLKHDRPTVDLFEPTVGETDVPVVRLRVVAVGLPLPV